MKTVTVFRSGVVVTGSSGFMGSAFCSQMSRAEPAVCVPADVTEVTDLQRVKCQSKAHTVVHLAANGSTVVAARENFLGMLSCAVEGSIKLIEILRPGRFLFLSSCAVYGNTPLKGVSTAWRNVNPLSVYGMSKATGELLVRQWAMETSNVAIVLRCGNVVGEGCRGLIDHLARHAVQHAKTGKPIRLRGAGKIVRDYVPVDFVGRVLMSALNAPFGPGAARTFNVGTGRGLTNRFVAETASAVLLGFGYPVNIEWQNTPAPGEAWTAVLDPKDTEEGFGIPPPSHEEVLQAIVAAAKGALQRALASSKAASMERCVDLIVN